MTNMVLEHKCINCGCCDGKEYVPRTGFLKSIYDNLEFFPRKYVLQMKYLEKLIIDGPQNIAGFSGMLFAILQRDYPEEFACITEQARKLGLHTYRMVESELESSFRRHENSTRLT